jgi:hypothetical protein
LTLRFTSAQLGDLEGGAGEREVLRGGEAGGDGLLLLLGEKVLLVCRLMLLFPVLLSPGMDLWDCLSGILSFFLECLLLGDLDQDSLSSLPLVLLMWPLLLGEGAGDGDGDLLLGGGAGAGEGDLDSVGGLDLFLLGGLLLSGVSSGDLSLFLLLPLTGLWLAEASLAPVFGWSLLCTDLGLEEDEVPGPVQRCLLGAFFFLCKALHCYMALSLTHPK